jgi:predicted transposase YbfD/YdcC
MQCTSLAASAATRSHATTAVTSSSLRDAFAQIADPRRAASVVYSVPSLLALAVTALLANQPSVLAIAEWAARQSDTVLAPLGLRAGQTPCQSTLQRLFARLDGSAVSAALTAAVAGAGAPAPARGSQGVALDGKAQRGRLGYQSGGCPVHALSAVLHASGVVLAQEPITAGSDTAEAELSVAPALLARLDWRGRVLTGAALFCQRHLCQQVLDAGGDYLLLVKDNQPTLAREIAWLFEPASAREAPLPLVDRRVARTVERGHGRTHDTRELVATTDLAAHSDWPGLAQVFRLERTWQDAAGQHRLVHAGVTSLPPEVADPARLLALKRGHWQIENGLHYVKDVTRGEDRSLIHAGQGPVVMGMLRDAVVSLLRRAGWRAIASRRRYLADRPADAVALVIQVTGTRA